MPDGPLVNVPPRVHNPLPRDVWFVFDVGDSFYQQVRRIELERTTVGSPAQVLSLDQVPFAIRLAPKADVSLPDLGIMVLSDQVFVAFADDVRVDGRSAPRWLGQVARASVTGDIVVERLETISERATESEFGARASIEVICSHLIDARDQGLWRSGPS
jgi:hypothetical protein